MSNARTKAIGEAGRKIGVLFGWLVLASAAGFCQVVPPDSLVLDGIPPISLELKQSVGRYLEFRTAGFASWHPTRSDMLITTRFADTMQLHRVRTPLGMRQQLTFSSEPVGSASYRPRTGAEIVLSQDTGGGEFFQLYRLDPADGRSTLLTDGQSRNLGGTWAHSGRQIAYTSTRRNGKDNDIYIMDPADPATDRRVLEVNGGGWSVADWSHDEKQLLLLEMISINKSHLHLLDLASGQRRQLTVEGLEPVAYGGACFAADDRSLFVTTDAQSEFRRLAEYGLPSPGQTLAAPRRILSGKIPWDVDEFDLSKDGKKLAFAANECGAGVLYLAEIKSGRVKRVAGLPAGVLTRLHWHENNRDLAFNVSSARAPMDVFTLDTARDRIERWTESETVGPDPARFSEPGLIKFKSFDGLEVSAFVYRPDPRKFPGKRPALINIHGGPESQSRPIFQARNNYFLNELGVALVFPNVRGSEGFGKTYLTLDNGFKREDSVRDIGALLDTLGRDAGLDANRFGVMGGSYGGYMVLACLVHYSDRLKCGVDVVGISNFLTFLKNTQDYRRDLRRVEYGDEREPAMREFLDRISPTTNVEKIKRPLLVVQGKNDPRVPVTEAEQMVKAIRAGGGTAWYLMAKDEGHGFAKKRNADFQFLATVKFLQENLLK